MKRGRDTSVIDSTLEDDVSLHRPGGGSPIYDLSQRKLPRFLEPDSDDEITVINAPVAFDVPTPATFDAWFTKIPQGMNSAALRFLVTKACGTMGYQAVTTLFPGNKLVWIGGVDATAAGPYAGSSARIWQPVYGPGVPQGLRARGFDADDTKKHCMTLTTLLYEHVPIKPSLPAHHALASSAPGWQAPRKISTPTRGVYDDENIDKTVFNATIKRLMIKLFRGKSWLDCVVLDTAKLNTSKAIISVAAGARIDVPNPFEDYDEILAALTTESQHVRGAVAVHKEFLGDWLHTRKESSYDVIVGDYTSTPNGDAVARSMGVTPLDDVPRLIKALKPGGLLVVTVCKRKKNAYREMTRALHEHADRNGLEMMVQAEIHIRTVVSIACTFRRAS